MTLEDYTKLCGLRRRIDFYQELHNDLMNGATIRITSNKHALDAFMLTDDEAVRSAFKTFVEEQLAIYKSAFDRVLIQTPHDYYKPACPLGHTDCVNDPARIKRFHPDYYRDLYGDLSISMAVKECCTTEKCYYDNIVE